MPFLFLILYHTKEYKGTTTDRVQYYRNEELYHTKEYKGTTTLIPCIIVYIDYIIQRI